MMSGRAAPRRPATRPVLIVALITSVCLLGDSALYVLLPSRLDVFAVSPTGAGLILGINRYVRVVSNTVAGWGYERLGFRVSFIGAILLASATTAGYGLFSGFWPLFLAHGLWGVSWSFLRLGGYMTVIESGGSSAVGRLMGLLQGVSRAGSLVAVIVGGVLADALGHRETFIIFGVLIISALSLVPSIHITSKKEHREENTPAGQTATKPVQDTNGPDRWKIRTLYAEACVSWLAVSGLIVSTAGFLVSTVAGEGITVLGVLLGVGTLSGSLIAMRWSSDLALSPLFGYLSDVLGRSRIILAAMSVALASLVFVAVNQSLILVVPAFGAAFVASAALSVSLNASIGELAPADRRTAVLSRYSTWSDIGAGTAPLIGLPLVSAIGFAWVYGGAAALVVVAALLYYWVFVEHGPASRW